MRSVYFVQCKYPSDKIEFNNMLGRWNYYGSRLDQSSGKNAIAVISPRGLPNLDKDFEFLRFENREKGFFKSVYLVVRKIKKLGNKVTFVSGDNQLALLFCILSFLLMRGKVRIQSQFHGDLYTKQGNRGVRGKIRVFTSRVAVKTSYSIRIVSRFQETEIRELFPNLQREFIVAPIPLDYSKIVSTNDPSLSYDVALVGRLHPERGISEATTIIKQLIANSPDLKILIVGRGKSEKKMKKDLQDQISSGAVEFVGSINSNELGNIYSKTKVLLSTAPYEGYGLTLREAALNGLQVVARANHGSEEASLDFPDHISLYGDIPEAISKIESTLELERDHVHLQGLLAAQRIREKLGLEALIASWIKD